MLDEKELETAIYIVPLSPEGYTAKSTVHS